MVVSLVYHCKTSCQWSGTASSKCTRFSNLDAVIIRKYVYFRVIKLDFNPWGNAPRLTALYSPKGWLYPFDVRAWSWGPGLQRASLSRSTWLLVSVARPKPRKTVDGPTIRSCCSRDRIFANGYTAPRPLQVISLRWVRSHQKTREICHTAILRC